jgi:hypothetical protein
MKNRCRFSLLGEQQKAAGISALRLAGFEN